MRLRVEASALAELPFCTIADLSASAVDGAVDPEAFKAEWRKEFKLRLSLIGCFEKKRSRSRFTDLIDLADYHGFEHLR